MVARRQAHWARQFIFRIALLVFLQAPFLLHADPTLLPIPTLRPSPTRASIVQTAQKLKGIPYVFGGETVKGFDCSGFVSYVFESVTGHVVPRTVALQAEWVLEIPRNKLQAGDLVFFTLTASNNEPDHVGIYLGNGNFIHSASAGSKTGVVINWLGDSSWSRRFVFAGRVVSESFMSGSALEWSAGALFEGDAFYSFGARGAQAQVGVNLPLWSNFALGIEGQVAWDRVLSTVRVPLHLVLGQVSGISIFMGPALTFGQPTLSEGTQDTPIRRYSAEPNWIASAGIRWSPLIINAGAGGAGIFYEMRFEHYVPLAGQEPNPGADRRAAVTLGLGLRFRALHY